MATLANLVVKLRGDASSLKRSTTQGGTALRNFRRQASQTRKSLLSVRGAVATLVGGLGLGALFQVSRQGIDRQSKLAKNLGTTTAAVQKLKLQAQLAGRTLEQVSQNVLVLTRKTGQATAGNKKAREAFEDLGLSVESLAQADPIARFQAVIKALGGVEGSADRARIANELFQEQWRELGPLIADQGRGFNRAREILDAAGLSALREEADSVTAMNDSITELQASLSALVGKGLSVVAPHIQALTDGLRTQLVEWLGVRGGADELAATLRDNFTDALGRAKDAIDSFFAPLRHLLGLFRQLKSSTLGKLVIGSVRGAQAVGEETLRAFSQGDLPDLRRLKEVHLAPLRPFVADMLEKRQLNELSLRRRRHRLPFASQINAMAEQLSGASFRDAGALDSFLHSFRPALQQEFGNASDAVVAELRRRVLEGMPEPAPDPRDQARTIERQRQAALARRASEERQAERERNALLRQVRDAVRSKTLAHAG